MWTEGCLNLNSLCVSFRSVLYVVFFLQQYTNTDWCNLQNFSKCLVSSDIMYIFALTRAKSRISGCSSLLLLLYITSLKLCIKLELDKMEVLNFLNKHRPNLLKNLAFGNIDFTIDYRECYFAVVSCCVTTNARLSLLWIPHLNVLLKSE